jgi:hypothetical protein
VTEGSISVGHLKQARFALKHYRLTSGSTVCYAWRRRILTSNVTAILVPYLKMAMERRKLRKQNKELELSPVSPRP